MAATIDTRSAHFSKTKMCKFELLGMCTKGTSCPFAHGTTELRGLPDLRCTKLCKTLIQTGVCNKKFCSFAHNKDELRSTGASHKTKLCRFVGHCALGAKCNFAHSDLELREAVRASNGEREAELCQASIPLPPGLGWDYDTNSGEGENKDVAALGLALHTMILQSGQAAEASEEPDCASFAPRKQDSNLSEHAPAYVRLSSTSDALAPSPLLMLTQSPPSSAVKSGRSAGKTPNAAAMGCKGFNKLEEEVATPGIYSDCLASTLFGSLPGAWETPGFPSFGPLGGLSPAFSQSGEVNQKVDPFLGSGPLGGSLVIDQSEDMWQAKSALSTSAALPYWPIRSVRTSESTLCTLSDMA